MIFKATEEQVKQIMCNAVNASTAVGLGIMYFKSKDYTPVDIKPLLKDPLIYGADYFDGRMVKLEIRQVDADKWRVTHPAYSPNPEYQSWAHRYLTLEELLASVPGINQK